MASTTPKQIGSQPGVFRWSKSSHGLAVAELVLASIILVFVIASVGVGEIRGGVGYPRPGIGALAGIIGVISGGLGVGAFRCGRGHHNCLMVGHFVMCIISAIIDFITFVLCVFILIALHSAASVYDYHYQYDRFDNRSGVKPVLGLTWVIMLSTLAHMVCSITSSAFTCNHLCANGSADVSVVYSPRSDASDLLAVEIKSPKTSDNNVVRNIYP